MKILKPQKISCAKCSNPYFKASTADLIRTCTIETGGTKSGILKQSVILFVTKGCGSVYVGKSKKSRLNEGTGIILPIASRYRIVAKEQMDTVLFVLDGTIGTTDLLGIAAPARGRNSATPVSLAMNTKLKSYVSSTVGYIADGLSCVCYQRMKIRELIHVIRTYYEPEVLERFFQPMFGKTAKFATIVYDNWYKAKTLDELAKMAGLSLSGFAKKFRKIFGVSAYQWIMEKKGERIITELWNGDKSIKQLTEEYNFYSVQHFGYYCKKRFGYSPGRIRQSAKKDRERSG